MTILDETIVNVALPVMRDELGFSQGGVSWVINAYLIAYGGLLVFAGRLGDLIGHKNVLLAGVTVFTVASAVAGLSQNSVTMVAARFGQGAGAALITAVTLALIVTMFTEPQEQTKAIGFYGFTFAGGGAFGLLVGGVLMQLTSWHWLFFINLPIGVISVIAGWKLLPGGKGLGIKQGLDVTGAALLVSSVSLLVYSVVNAEHSGWTAVTTLSYAAGALILLTGFVIRQRMARVPLFNLGILRSRVVAGANIVQFLVVGAMYGGFFLATQYMQQIHGYSPLQVALAFLPMTGAIGLSSLWLIGVLTPKIGERGLLLLGLGLFLVGAGLLARTPIEAGYLVDVLPATLFLGFGMGLGYPPILSLAMSTAKEDEVGVISGLANSTGQVGGAMWVAVVGSVIGSVAVSAGGTGSVAAVNSGLMYGSFVMIGILAAAVLVTLFVIGRVKTPADGESTAPALVH
ncbi:MFS transporter [Lentzea guizhouensis]